MSDDDRDIDVESDEGNDSDSRQQSARHTPNSQFYSQVSNAEKRAHHNALERKRRDHIKDSFSSLRDSVPTLSGEKVKRVRRNASRAQILKKAAEYIQLMRRKNNSHQQDIEDLKRQNHLLETQIRTLEKARSGQLNLEQAEIDSESSDVSDLDGSLQPRKAKKIKVSGYH